MDEKKRAFLGVGRAAASMNSCEDELHADDPKRKRELMLASVERRWNCDPAAAAAAVTDGTVSGQRKKQKHGVDARNGLNITPAKSRVPAPVLPFAHLESGSAVGMRGPANARKHPITENCSMHMGTSAGALAAHHMDVHADISLKVDEIVTDDDITNDELPNNDISANIAEIINNVVLHIPVAKSRGVFAKANAAMIHSAADHVLTDEDITDEVEEEDMNDMAVKGRGMTSNTSRVVLYSADDIVTDADITDNDEQLNDDNKSHARITTQRTGRRTTRRRRSRRRARRRTEERNTATCPIDVYSDDDDDDDASDDDSNSDSDEDCFFVGCHQMNPFATRGPSVPEFQRKGRLAFYLNKLPDVQDNVSLSIRDVIPSNHPGLQSVVILSYRIDVDWLYSQLPGLDSIPTKLVKHEKRHDGQNHHEMRALQAMSKYPLCSMTSCRPWDPFGTHHTKLTICKFTTGLRLCIGSANMQAREWDRITQAIYVQDFPLKDDNSPSSSTFADDLTAYLKATQLLCDDKMYLAQLIRLVRQHDMSGATGMLVGSVPGRHTGTKGMAENGFLRLTKCVERDYVPPEALLVVNVSSISLPPANAKWLRGEFCHALLRRAHANNIHVMWPTKPTVDASEYGGGGLFFNRKNAQNDTYLRKLHFHQYDAAAYGRQNYVVHMKSIVRFLPSEDNDDVEGDVIINPNPNGSNGSISGRGADVLYWMYIGSHNLSRAAWGEYQNDDTQTQVRSFELGVVFTRTSYKPLHRHIGFTCTPDSPLPGQTIAPTSAEFQMRALPGNASVMEENVLFFPVPYAITADKYKDSDVPFCQR